MANRKTNGCFPVRIRLWVLLIACLPWGTALDAQETQRLYTDGTTMGVVSYSATVFGDLDQAPDFEVAVFDELELVNQLMSTYLPDSDVSRFNKSVSTQWFAVTLETATVVQRALEICENSDGAFDITVQPLVQFWQQVPEQLDSFGFPTQQEIDRQLQSIGYEHLEARLDPPSIRKTIPGLQIDLSAIAKGYAVDRVAERLIAMGFDNFLVEVGGEIRAAGEKPEKQPWKVGIEKPLAGERTPWRVIDIYEKSLASSGDYRNFFEYEGKRYSHTIDPRTGFPVDHAVAAASVLAADCMTADAIATAMMVLGKEPGIRFAREMGVEAVVLERTASEIVATETSAFPGAANVISGEGDTSIFRMIAVACVFFLFAIIAMAIGVIFGRERIKGSCGGIAALDNPDIKPECSLCSRAAECDDLKKEVRKREQARETGESES